MFGGISRLGSMFTGMTPLGSSFPWCLTLAGVGLSFGISKWNFCLGGVGQDVDRK